MQYQQAYFTTSYPVDESGNFYFPVFIPENVMTNMPITTIKPDPSLGNRGLIFDWESKKWRTSDRDPLMQKLNKLKQQVQTQQTIQLQSMKNIMNNVAKQDAAKKDDQPVSSASLDTKLASSSASQAKEAAK